MASRLRDVLAASSFLPGTALRDPADRLLAATAQMVHAATSRAPGPALI